MNKNIIIIVLCVALFATILALVHMNAHMNYMEMKAVINVNSGINDVRSFLLIGLEGLEDYDKIYFYTKAMNGISLAIHDLQYLNYDSEFNNVLNELKFYLDHLDFMSDEYKPDLELYNLLIFLNVEKLDLDLVKKIDKYLGNQSGYPIYN